MEDYKPVGTPMVTRHKLSSTDETPTVEQKKYRSMIRGLQYLTHKRPDIAHSVGIIERFQAEPRESHYAEVKRILRYLKGTMDYGLWYENSDDFTLCAYTDVDWGGSIDDKKRTSGGAFFLGGKLVSWLSKKQNCISQSTAEVEYVAAANNCNQIIWMK